VWRWAITGSSGTGGQPLVSVIIATYNYGEYLRDAIRSLQRQTYDAWECIVVDDGSTDETGALVSRAREADNRVRYLRHDNRGMSAARNTGLAAARGSYIQFLDADDALQERKLEIHVRYLETHPDCDIVEGAWGYWDGATSWRGHPRNTRSLPDGAGRPVIEALLYGNMIAINAALMRARAAGVVGKFDTSIEAHEDWEYWLRGALRGLTYAHVDGPATMALVRRHVTSVSHDQVRMLQGLIQVRRRLDGELTEPWQRQMNRDLLADAEVWLGTRIGVQGSLRAGMKLVLRGALRRRSARHCVRLAVLPLVATRPGRWIGARFWPRLYGTTGATPRSEAS